MGVPQPAHDNARSRAREIVNFWRKRAWLSSATAPLHVHPLDLDKLEELIASALTDTLPINPNE